MKFPERLKKPGYRYLAGIIVAAVVLTAPRWGRAAMHRMTYFHVRKLDIRGVRYLQPSDIVARLRVDTLRSIVDDITPLEARLKSHPQVADVHITRRFPGTLIVTVTENMPVALVPRGDGLQPYDSAGRALPIDPSSTNLDLPVVTAPDRGALRLMGELRAVDPRMFALISEVAPVGQDLVFTLNSSLRVRASAGVAPERFRDIFPVESDLARRNERAAELDIRYRDQVVARLE
ncbi:MAG TPA: FtsQ-type POTRA domain-containing protein [Gemmatimonadaceae bacterium]|nr:FtsQ-type POTRA domain-containing protein [Gemmatimonadaceae bacterium]